MFPLGYVCFPKGNRMIVPAHCAPFAKQRQYGRRAPMAIVSPCPAQKQGKARTEKPLEAKSHEQGLCSPFSELSLLSCLHCHLNTLNTQLHLGDVFSASHPEWHCCLSSTPRPAKTSWRNGG